MSFLGTFQGPILFFKDLFLDKNNYVKAHIPCNIYTKRATNNTKMAQNVTGL